MHLILQEVLKVLVAVYEFGVILNYENLFMCRYSKTVIEFLTFTVHFGIYPHCVLVNVRFGR